MSGSDVTPIPASSIASWDDEADVVIAGYGIAGAAAAVEAARHGADGLVPERTGSWGGAAAMAGGGVFLSGASAPATAARPGRFPAPHCGSAPHRVVWWRDQH